MATVTIHHLEVRFQVEGDDTAVFTRLFERHMQAWGEAYTRECDRSKRTKGECAYGDREIGR